MGVPSKIGFGIFNRIIRRSDRTNIALVENGMVCFDYNERKVCPLPDTVIDVCNRMK